MIHYIWIVFSKPSYSIIDRMAPVKKVKCAGLDFDGAADKVFNAALHLQMGQNR